MEKYISTYKEGIKITDLQRGDLIYVKKMRSEYDRYLQCKFMRLNNGIVEVEVIKIWDPWSSTNGEWKDPAEFDRGFFKNGMLESRIVTARPSSCFLWGKGKGDDWECCHWL